MTFRKHLFQAFAFLAIVITTTISWGQTYNSGNNSAVGGVSIDANGLLTNSTTVDNASFVKERTESLSPISADLKQSVPARKISLKAIDQIVRDCESSNQPIPDAVLYLGGLTKIDFVFAYPQSNDIVLVGPAEPWKIGSNGAPVGVKSGAPILLLEDLITALQTTGQAQRGPMSCSIDPTSEGLQNLRQYTSRLVPNMNPQVVARNIEQRMGDQSVRVSGVPATSHFARVMVASDYQMKQISMGVRPASVKGLPPFTKMVKTSSVGASNALPRWWMAPNYGTMLRDEAGLSWKLQGGTVKTMCETDFFAENGQLERGAAKTSAGVQKWADTMTSRFDDLSKAEPIFGQLRNCMDVAVVAALIRQENLLNKVDNSLSGLTNAETTEFVEPKAVPCMAAVSKARKVTIVCGGVDIDPWMIVNNTAVDEKLSQVREASSVSTGAFFAN